MRGSKDKEKKLLRYRFVKVGRVGAQSTDIFCPLALLERNQIAVVYTPSGGMFPNDHQQPHTEILYLDSFSTPLRSKTIINTH